VIRNQNKSTSIEHSRFFSSRFVPLGLGEMPQAQKCRRQNFREKETVRSAFCDQEIKTKGTCEFQVQFLFVAVCTFGAGRDAKILMEERREKGISGPLYRKAPLGAFTFWGLLIFVITFF
jgi:hypothetical protein